MTRIMSESSCQLPVRCEVCPSEAQLLTRSFTGTDHFQWSTGRHCQCGAGGWDSSLGGNWC